jgi:hypothetical protein
LNAMDWQKGGSQNRVYQATLEKHVFPML